MQFTFLGLDFEITRMVPAPSVVSGALKMASESLIPVQADLFAASVGDAPVVASNGAERQVFERTPGASLAILRIMMQQSSFAVTDLIESALHSTGFLRDQIEKAIWHCNKAEYAVASDDKQRISITDLGRARAWDARLSAKGGCKPQQ